MQNFAKAPPSVALAATVLTAAAAASAPTSAKPLTRELRFTASGASVAGTLVLPGRSPAACVLIVGGTLSQDRDGRLMRAGVPNRDALRRLAEELCRAGFASFRYDRVGYGQSIPQSGWKGSYREEGEVAAGAVRMLRALPDVSSVAIAGESAGAYVACLAARDGTTADAYLFLGALAGPSRDLYEHTLGGLARWAAGSPERLKTAMREFRLDLALGRTYPRMPAAAESGPSEVELVDDEFRFTMRGLARRKEELDFPPDEMFRYIRRPALALAGERDLNVPPLHAARAAAMMRDAGNTRVASSLILGADHSFQQTPADEDERVRDRYSLNSFSRPYEPRFYQQVIGWLKQTLPVIDTSRLNTRAGRGEEYDPPTAHTPARVQLAPGVEIIDNVTDRRRTTGVQTLEGRIARRFKVPESHRNW